MKLRLENKDCMEVMAEYPDGYFDLILADPPYGIGAGSVSFISGTRKKDKHIYRTHDWDTNIPNDAYFKECFRVSKNQIFCGGNYMTNFLPPSRCWIVWDKKNDGMSYADFEMIWTSFDSVSKFYRKFWSGANGLESNELKRIHPTQKPISLYEWILKNYAKPEFKILDSHLGSGSSLIACHNFNIAEFVGCEIDKDYFDAMLKRYDSHKLQLKLF